MRVIFTPAARAEILEAQGWYEQQQPGLGTRFRDELETVVKRISENPYQFPVALDDVHRGRLHKFPYTLFFRIETDSLIAVACFHGSRDPQRWQERL